MEPSPERVKYAISNFYNSVLEAKLPGIMQDFCFDVYLGSSKPVWLLDFSPFSKATDPLLYSWDELHSRSGNAEVGVDMRTVDSEAAVVPSQLAAHCVPADFVSDPKGFVEKFVESCRNGTFDVQ